MDQVPGAADHPPRRPTAKALFNARQDGTLRVVRLYLSSFRMGDCPEQLVRLMRGGRRVAVVANATDNYPPEDRPEAVDRELTALTALGLEPAELDLRDYFARPGLAEVLRSCDLIWVRGGNTFALRYALARSGADREVSQLIAVDAVAYGGYSAGVCVLAPTLKGLDISDDPSAVNLLYDAEPLWDGLGVLDFCVVPHVGTPDRPGDPICERIADRYRADGTPHRTLSDGEVLIVDGDREWTCGS